MIIATHSMSDARFGAEYLSESAVRFRLWAPSAKRVDLVLETGAVDGGSAREERMKEAGDGWCELAVSGAAAGDRYRYRIDGDLLVPDPASRFQPDGVHGASEIIDPAAFQWTDGDWTGRPWHEAVVYELHVGSCAGGGGPDGTGLARASAAAPGTYAGVEAHLDRLADLGVTAIELMPLAECPGRWGWGYDGALLFAPKAGYGRPEDLKRLVQAAHARGLMVLLDVVYNHFGPEGNYLHRYAAPFFHPDRHTPWGAAIDFDGARSHWVREFFIQNALYWIEEYRFDGLRLDAVDRIIDARSPDVLDELAARVRAGPGRERHVHLVLENDFNDVRRYRRDGGGRSRLFTAQWNDDFHHAFHALLTGEGDGPYQDFNGTPGRPAPMTPLEGLARALAEGFAYQGEPSAFRDDAARGTASAELPPLAFVNFLQNHDQAGNRAFGERLHQLVSADALDAALGVLLLAPSPPLLFMGEEMDAPSPFLFFCDFGPELAAAVREGRRREFARSAGFRDAASLAAIPDPNDPATFERSCVDWGLLDAPAHRRRVEQVRALLALRRREILPLLPLIRRGGSYRTFGDGGLAVVWALEDGRRLRLLANLSALGVEVPAGLVADGIGNAILIHPTETGEDSGRLPAWSVRWSLIPCESAPAAATVEGAGG